MTGPDVGSIPFEIIASLPTPCLVVDLPKADRNIDLAVATAYEQGVRLRPHFKAHKCSPLLRRQVEAGGCSGVTCQTAREAVVLAEAGFRDILVASQIVDRDGLSAIADVASEVTVTVAVDSLQHVELLAAHVVGGGTTLQVVIELDVGMGRCGLPAGSSSLIPIASAIEETSGLGFAGLQAYEGHAVLREDRALRSTMVWQAASQVIYERGRLEAAGFNVSLVTGGGTGTLDLAGTRGVLDEVQAGSYVLMDARYSALNLPFVNAVYCIGTIVSRRSEDVAVANIGLKALTAEYGMPQPIDEGLSVIALSDEHARLAVADSARIAIGDPVVLIPAHIDPAINLHDVLFVWTDQGLEFWPVDGRRTLWDTA